MIKPHVTLGASFTPAGKSPPSEFRLFKAGPNDTLKGTFVFDRQAAQSVMAAAAARGGVEYPIDLEHLSLDQESRSYDPDARGWFSLQVRNGELWAVNVRWTNDGARRLMEGLQRYISPAFLNADKRITEIVNVALCAMPATHQAPALIAAKRGTNMTPTISTLSARITLANQRLAASKAAPALDIVAAAERASKALASVAEASDPNATAAALEAAVEAIAAFEEALALAGMAGEQTFTTSRGPMKLTVNQLIECKRAGAKPEVMAERLSVRLGASH